MSVVLDANVAYHTQFGNLYQYLVDNINQNDLFINNTLDIAFDVMRLADKSLTHMEPAKRTIVKKIAELFHSQKGVVRT